MSQLHPLLEAIRQATHATSLKKECDIQTLWSGYGSIMRYRLVGAEQETVIIKHVRLPDRADHPRGWNSDRSHKRKIRSYQVESHWYRHFSEQCDESCRVARCYLLGSDEQEFLMVLEDLDAAGYGQRHQSLGPEGMKRCIDWLANFHATFMGVEPGGLWEIGTYWHLATRPDELEALDDAPLQQAAPEIDRILRQSPYQTLVHGDAKLANFCFSEDGQRVAAVDFQYVGGGCGMKDLAYFVGSCLHEADCERRETMLLDNYFQSLDNALQRRGSPLDAKQIEAAWRPLYSVAWTDFHRFVKGWSPGHWKIHGYSERLSRQVLSQLSRGAI